MVQARPAKTCTKIGSSLGESASGRESVARDDVARGRSFDGHEYGTVPVRGDPLNLLRNQRERRITSNSSHRNVRRKQTNLVPRKLHGARLRILDRRIDLVAKRDGLALGFRANPNGFGVSQGGNLGGFGFRFRVCDESVRCRVGFGL